MSTAIVSVRKLISKNKAIAAAVSTLLGSLGSAAVSVIVTGNIDPTEIRTAAGGVVLSLVTYVATYLTNAGDAEVQLPSQF
jgi:predicted regulator of Ras-like GTPase activity (Roadblock/LC7/MglB family)